MAQVKPFLRNPILLLRCWLCWLVVETEDLPVDADGGSNPALKNVSTKKTDTGGISASPLTPIATSLVFTPASPRTLVLRTSAGSHNQT